MNPMMAQVRKMPGFDAMQRQQRAFLETMMAGWSAIPGLTPGQQAAPDDSAPQTAPQAEARARPASEPAEDLTEIKRQLAALEAKLSKLGR